MSLHEYASYVISGRIRLARNLMHTPFPSRCSTGQREAVLKKVEQALVSIDHISFRRVTLDTLSDAQTLSLVEKHLISKEFASQSHAVALISSDDSISIMVNEEDHLRIQFLCDGLHLSETYRLAAYLDQTLDEQLAFAFDEQWGFLTQCPTNLGTGLRASVMLHLPALHETGAIHNVAQVVQKLGIAIRGSFGERSKVHGAFYQISNQTTLGISEQDAIERLENTVVQILAEERKARAKLLAQDTFEDRLWRAYGVLQTARLITCEEAISLLSLVRLGVCEGIFTSLSLADITRLMTEIQPGCLMASSGEAMDPSVRDRRRAEIVRIGVGGIHNN